MPIKLNPVLVNSNDNLDLQCDKEFNKSLFISKYSNLNEK
jgi:hypothetical protein